MSSSTSELDGVQKAAILLITLDQKRRQEFLNT